MFKRIGTHNGATLEEKKQEILQYLFPGEVVTRWHVGLEHIEADIFDGKPEEVTLVKNAPWTEND